MRRIFHMYIHEGLGSPSIAVRLTDEGIPTQTGKLLWRQSYIHYVLANATYTGTWVYGKARHISTEGRDEVVRTTEGHLDRGPGSCTGGRGDVGAGAGAEEAAEQEGS